MNSSDFPTHATARPAPDQNSGVRDLMRANERQREQRLTTACVAGER